MEKRRSGVLLHISSLPSRFGIGDLGPAAYRFVDFLSETKQSIWQILPVNPTDAINSHSPYSSISAFAANSLFISPEILKTEGLLQDEDLKSAPNFSPGRVDYELVSDYKQKIFAKAFAAFKDLKSESRYMQFCSLNSYWLEDFSLFVALKERYKGEVWSNWPLDLRDRDKDCLKRVTKELAQRINKEKFFQYEFFKQWKALKEYSNQKGVEIFGDIPIYVNYDSVDTWAKPEIFNLDENKKLALVAGVPPDYFSKTGQRWGNPVFRWDRLKDENYSWWLKRIDHNLKLFDIIRIDHFRGFIAYWQIPASEETAVKGKWVKAPAEDFFQTLLKRFPTSQIVAEDLGIITPEVKRIIKKFGFPGMKILMFAFGEDKPEHPYLPNNFIENCVVYTGTHDNNTIRGWFENEADNTSKKRLFLYIGKECAADELNWEFIKLAFKSIAKIAIIPMQDILGLAANARMNLPSTLGGNWSWRFLEPALTPEIKQRLKGLTQECARA